MSERKKITREDLTKIEVELNIRLAADYAEALLEDPFEGRGQEFCTRADEIIEQTKWYREEGFYGLEWPDNYLVIGDDGAGDANFIDLTLISSPVFFADHEYAAVDNRWQITEEAPNIAGYIEKVREIDEEWLADPELNS